MKKIVLFVSFAALSLQLTACSNPVNSNVIPSASPSSSVSAANSQVTPQQVIEHYATQVYQSYQIAHQQAVQLQTAVNDFVKNPSDEKLLAARQAWLKSRTPYSLTEAFRFYQGPIDHEEGPEAQLNSWPLDEAYIDAVEGQPQSGIVSNSKDYPVIDQTLLRKLNQEGGDKNVSTGYHAIEFLLWGQDLSEGPGAGQRSFNDYVISASPQATRRAQYLQVATDMLVSDLQSLIDAWKPGVTDNYRAEFIAMAPDQALKNILRGIGTLSASELASERLGTPLDIGEREEEHSCFSDNTHQDIRDNTQSIANVLTGTYIGSGDTKGPGIIDLVNIQSPELAQKLREASAKTLNLAAQIKAPFDQEIRPDNAAGKQRVLDLIQALKQQGALIVEAGQSLGIAVNTDL